MIRLQEQPIDAHALTDQVIRKECGAVVLFLGTVREQTHGKITQALTYEAYRSMAESELAKIEADVRSRWPVGDVAIVHRLGRLELTEISVAIAVSTPHRHQAFAAAQFAMERVKEMVPIWKLDHAPDGMAEWVHAAASKGGE